MACPFHRPFVLWSRVQRRRTRTEAAVCLGDTVHLNTFYVCKIAGFVKSRNKEILIIITSKCSTRCFSKSWLSLPKCSVRRCAVGKWFNETAVNKQLPLRLTPLKGHQAPGSVPRRRTPGSAAYTLRMTVF